MTATFNYKNNMKSAYKLITKKMNTRQSILLLLSIMVFNVLSYAQPTAVVHVGSQQNVGYTVCFDGSDSFGDGGDKFTEKDEIMNFIWNFGDGTPEESGEYLNTHTHVYNKAGNYTVTLTVIDYEGESDITSTSITVGTLPKVTVTGNTTSAISFSISLLKGGPGIVYIPAGDYKYDSTVNVPEGTIIEGGGSPGTRVYNNSKNGILFYAIGNNFRITGLKLEGFSIVPSETDHKTVGISASDKKNVLIDHCEISGFQSGIAIGVKSTATIEYCYIHHNLQNGYGYGIVVATEAYAMVRHNEMSNCRHAITSSGCTNYKLCPTRYDFFYNHIQGYKDVEDKGYQVDTHAAAHGRVRVNFNVFEDLIGGISLRDGLNVQIKGNIFRNIDPNEGDLQYGNAINTHAPTHGSGLYPPGIDGCDIVDNIFENCHDELWLEYGKNICVNGRKMDDLIPYMGSVDWNESSSLSINNTYLPEGIIGEDYYTILKTTNGTPPVVWSIYEGLPFGLNLNIVTGEITGIPIQAERKVITVHVRDANNSTTSKSLTITINTSQEPDYDAIQTGGNIIDGNLSEFNIANTISFVDSSGRGTTKDNSAIAQFMWDNVNLFLGIEVFDTELNAVTNENDNNSTLWKDDCVEIFIDPDSDGGNSMQSDDFRYSINLNEYTLDGNGFSGWNWNGSSIRKVKLSGTLNYNDDSDNNYTVEVAIPWSDLGITPEQGKIIGIQIGITDLDAEGNYEYFGWPLANSSFNNPTGWAKVQLTNGLRVPIIAEQSTSDPQQFTLMQNYPNPFNPGTLICYQIPHDEKVIITIYNLLGEQVRLLMNDNLQTGNYSVHWNGRDNSGEKVPAGLYICQIQAGSFIQSKKMTLLR